jgi:hypothetical protein
MYGVTWEQIILGLTILPIPLFPLWLVYQVPSVWRGEKQSITLPSQGYAIDVNVRNFPTFAISLFCFLTIGSLWGVLKQFGIATCSQSTFVHSGPLACLSFLPFAFLMAVGVFLFPMVIFISAFNRPKFLVPPPYR